MNTDELDKLIRGKHINFLIGSGASTPMYPTLKIGETNHSFEDIVSHNKISDISKTLMYSYYFEKWLYPMAYSRKEFVKNYGDSKVLDDYRNLIIWFYNFLQGESNELPKRINIFTTNYDLIFERIFDEFILEYPLIYFNDGSRGVFRKYISNKNYYLNISHSGYNDNYKREVPTINLFKLHGSLSWQLDEDNIMVADTESNDTIKSVKSILKKLEIDKEYLERLISKCNATDIDGFINELNNETRSCKIKDTTIQHFYTSYNKIPIINPNKYKFNKTVSEQHYYQLIRSFSYELECKQTILIVFGFSFADEHIKDIFIRSLLNPELQVIIISYSKGDQEKMRASFDGYKNIKFLPEKHEYDNDKKGNFKYLLSLLKNTGDKNEN